MRGTVFHVPLSSNSFSNFRGGLTAALVWGALTQPAAALEPLDHYLSAAAARSFGAQEASLVAAQRDDAVEQARRALLPTVTATARYVRNQYEAVARVPTGTNGDTREAVFTPIDQRDLTVTGTLPLVDVARWQQLAASKQSRAAGEASHESAQLEAQRTAVRQYYRVVASEALTRSTEDALAAAQKNLEWLRARRSAGLASELDERRAQADVERNRNLVADAVYQCAVARRALETVSGVAPSPGAPALSAGLAPESPLEDWLGVDVDEQVPSVRARGREALAQAGRAKAAQALLYPTLEASASERFTNAPGFGQQPYYQLGVTASLRLDAAALSALRAERHGQALAELRATRARREALDAIHDAWFDVARQLEKSRASRAELEASALAARIARERYEAGTATFLDVVLAERERVGSDASRIRAEADLCSARAELRLLAGRALEPTACTGAAP
jgi:outer membrane protein TolC